MYEGSIHERMLDEQVRNYRAYAKKMLRHLDELT
jgi:hypothetical protein